MRTAPALAHRMHAVIAREDSPLSWFSRLACFPVANVNYLDFWCSPRRVFMSPAL